MLFQNLNWTNKPFKEDVQISIRYQISNVFIYHLKSAAVSLISEVITPSYVHHWKDGTLLHIEDAWICFEMENSTLEIACRVNADGVGVTSAMEYVWIQITPFIMAIEHFIHSWCVGEGVKRKIIPAGTRLTHGIGTSHPIDVTECLVARWIGDSVCVETDGRNDIHIEAVILLPFPVGDNADWLNYVNSVCSKRGFILPTWQAFREKTPITLSPKNSVASRSVKNSGDSETNAVNGLSKQRKVGFI